MRDARYLRRQADLCLEMARKIGDPVTSHSLVAEAARHHAEADKIESGVTASVTKAAAEQRD